MIRDTSSQDTAIAQPPARLRRRRAGQAAAALAALAILAAITWSAVDNWSASEHSVKAARLRIAAVTRGTLIRDAAVNGRIVAAVSPTLYATAPSSTVTLKVRAGDTVKRGDVLAVLESPDLADELKKEQSGYQELAAEVARQQILARKQALLAQRDADTAEIDRLSAQRTLERYDSVANEGVVARIDYQRAKDALRAAEIRARHATQASTLERDDVDLALRTKTAQLERQELVLANARRRVGELMVRAPVDGFVGTLNVANRSVVQANTPLMTLVDLSALEVELEVPETYVNDLGLGMRAEITVNGATTGGKLTALSPEVVKNQVLARVRFEGRQPAGLRQSQRVQARLLIDEKRDVLLLPRGPFVESEGRGAPCRAGKLSSKRRAAGRAGILRCRPTGAGAAEPVKECARIRFRAKRRHAGDPPRAGHAANRSNGPRPRHERHRARQRAGAVLFHQAQRYRTGPGTGARDRRGAWRPDHAGEPRRRRADRHPAAAGAAREQPGLSTLTHLLSASLADCTSSQICWNMRGWTNAQIVGPLVLAMHGNVKGLVGDASARYAGPARSARFLNRSLVECCQSGWDCWPGWREGKVPKSIQNASKSGKTLGMSSKNDAS